MAEAFQADVPAGPDSETQAPPPELSDADPIFRNLAILPPRQKEDNSTAGLPLPLLRADEPVQSLRSALAEVVGYAHLTNFRFELEAPAPRAKNGGGTGNHNIVSPFTGKDAVIVVPVQMRDGQLPVLDDFGDLTSLVDKGLQDGSGFRIVLQRYDAAAVKEHVFRLRSLFEGSVPTSTTLADEKEEDAEQEQEESTEEKETAHEKENSKGKAKKPLPDLKRYDVTSGHLAVDGTNLGDFFYLAGGEEYEELHNGAKSKKKKKGKNGKPDDDVSVDETQLAREKIPRWNEVESLCHIDCTIRYSAFHPPPPKRRWMGDIAYFDVSFGGTVLCVTSTTMGFYINRTQNFSFDPSPALDPHYSHSMLDCLLSASPRLRAAWSSALEAAKERAEILSLLNRSPYTSLFRIAQRGDFDGFKSAAAAEKATSLALDASLLTPSWLVPQPRTFANEEGSWTGNRSHPYSPHRRDEDLQNTFGVDIRNGASRDWNEELQSAREMATDSLPERVERARIIHKVMADFGEAALIGVKAISEGHILPMNPNEPARSQVYLHNNIFFSRGVDSGPETFKIAQGENAARKAANRDVQCIGTFHRMEKSGLYTLATVVIDFMGTRFVCQSILPGILVGERSHKLLYGSVETGIPIKWDEELHKILEEKVGGGMRIATRPVYAMPLTKERLDEIQTLKKATPLLAGTLKESEEAEEDVDGDAVINTCIPIEAKGILGSDHRKYVLDFSRLTPRDANWVPKEEGGTGRFEEAAAANGNSNGFIPKSLDDDEWTMNVLRPEMVTRFTQVSIAKRVQARREKEEEEKAQKAKEEASPESTENKESVESANDKKAEEDDSANKLTEEELEYLETLRLNVNLFLPHVRSFEGVNDEAAAMLKADEQLAREVAEFLWDDVLPRLTRVIKEGSMHQIPVDGSTLTELLRRNGINCRYMGRLATLAQEEEEKDAKVEEALKAKKRTLLARKLMPKCWLEMLECEMVARAAKHVLDGYLRENGGRAASQPAQTIASFLSALVSEAEETAAQTETRLEKRAPSVPDEEDVGALTISGVGGGGDAVLPPVRSRHEVWRDIEAEIGRRFRYSLSLYNKGNKSKRAQHIPLLRRVCQRTGVRLLAKNYDLVSGRCFCGGIDTFDGRLSPSYPISPLDIADIVPLMKHSAAYGEGFTPCTVGATIGLPALQISLPDARAFLERAHIQTGNRQLHKGLELAQEAASLYQRVVDNPAHPGVIESLELMATIFLEGGDTANAAINGAKVLALTIQNGSFDSAAAFNAHMSLFQMLFAAGEMDQAVKHIRAAIYVLEIMAGPHHIEHYTAYHRLGTTYSHEDYKDRYLSQALGFYEEAQKRDLCDRLVDGVTSGSIAKIQTTMENFKEALDNERKAFQVLSLFLGKDHQLTKDSDQALKNIMQLALAKGNQEAQDNKEREASAKAESVADALVSEEDKKKKKSNKKKKKSKK